MIINNYHCKNEDCNYRTDQDNQEDAYKQVIRDRGFVSNLPICPKCKKATLVFISLENVRNKTK